MKKSKFPVTNTFLDLKSRIKHGNINLEEFDNISRKLINDLGILSLRGIKEVENIDINLWKDRVWFLIEKVGLLPKLAKHELADLEEVEGNDDWYRENTEFDFKEMEPILTKLERPTK